MWDNEDARHVLPEGEDDIFLGHALLHTHAVAKQSKQLSSLNLATKGNTKLRGPSTLTVFDVAARTKRGHKQNHARLF